MNKAESYLKGATKRIANAAGKVTATKAKAEAKLQGVGRTIRKNAGILAADVKKNGIHIADDDAILGKKKRK